MSADIDPLFDRLPDTIRKMQEWAQSRPECIKAVQAEMNWSPEDVADLYQHKNDPAYALGDMPLVVLTRAKGGYDGRTDSLQLERERLRAQEALARLSTNSKHVIDPNSGHNIHVEDPATVIASIKEVYDAVTKHRRLR